MNEPNCKNCTHYFRHYVIGEMDLLVFGAVTVVYMAAEESCQTALLHGI